MQYFQIIAIALPAWFLAERSHALTLPSRSNVQRACRYLPSDPEWPSAEVWNQLNTTVNGGLIAAELPGRVCHGSIFNESACDEVRDAWGWADMHWQDPTSVQNPYFLNDTCSPFTSRESPCILGNIASYAINVSSADDVAAGVKFAQANNIRLVVKNTGHDFLGRSTGRGSLSLWMHNLKQISFTNYTSSSYVGAAAKLGAGVQAHEAYEAADANGYRIVGGSCPTVGLVGGYTQGAGHGPLSGEYGLAADNTLEWEVVTSTGEYLVANRDQNQDLYWALSGGGGGTYAVVLSLTTKAHPDGQVGGGVLQFNSSDTPTDKFWDAVEVFNEQLPALINHDGLEFVYTLSNSTFWLYFITWPGHSADEVAAAVSPFSNYLDGVNINYSTDWTSFPGFWPHFAHYTPGLPFGTYPVNELLGGRNIPYSTIERNNSALTAALRNITQTDPTWVLNGVCSNVSHERTGTSPEQNAVLPAWRDTAIFFNVVIPWDSDAPAAQEAHLADVMTYEVVPQLEAVSPGSGTYINEGAFNLPSWKEDFFGSNYERLFAIKKKYDPDDLLYSVPSVGNDVWEVQGDGRICRTQ